MGQTLVYVVWRLTVLCKNTFLHVRFLPHSLYMYNYCTCFSAFTRRLSWNRCVLMSSCYVLFCIRLIWLPWRKLEVWDLLCVWKLTSLQKLCLPHLTYFARHKTKFKKHALHFDISFVCFFILLAPYLLNQLVYKIHIGASCLLLIC